MAKKKKKKKRIWSHVKRLKIRQKKNPVSPAKYKKMLREARRKDFGRNFSIVLIALCALILIGFAGANMYLKKESGENLFDCMRSAEEMVKASKAEDFRLSETSYIYSDDGTELADLAEDSDATYLEYDEIPPDVINAFVAVEDRTFWTNSGIDLKGILRVCVDYVRSRGQSEAGASTITQQFARTEFLTQEKKLSRKIKEIFIARELTKKYSKQQIMEFYCNTCCFANGIYGVEDAAQTYFGRPVSDLSLSETAYICAIPNRPEYYNPYNNPENAVKRRDKILEDMAECSFISSSAKEEASAEKMKVVEKEEDRDFYNYEVTYAINCAVKFFMRQSGFEFRHTFDSEEDYEEYNKLYDEAYKQAKHDLYTGGYQVTTTMNLDTQRELQKVLDDGLAFSDDKVEKTGIYELQGAMTVIDNKSGKVVAMIGGRSQEEIEQTYSLNRGFQGFAQPGSSFKPLAVYAPALNEGYEPSSPLKNIDVDRAKKMTSAEIDKMGGSSRTLRSAVENSTNGCAYWLFNILGPREALSYVMDMNFSRIVPEDYTLSASLGGLYHGVSTEEMANAYYTLENHGEYTQTDCISSIIDRDGQEIYELPESKQIYDEDAADTMTDVMMGVLKRGTASRLHWSSESGTDAAGKTGTTNDNKAGWFCGYTPYYTIAVWVGCDQPKTVDNLSGNTYPAEIWKDAMLSLIEDLPDAEFDIEKSSSGYSYKPQKEEPEEEPKEDEAEKKDPDKTKDDPKKDETMQPDNAGGTTAPDVTEPPEDVQGEEIEPQIPEQPAAPAPSVPDSGGTTGSDPAGGDTGGDTAGGSTSGGDSAGGTAPQTAEPQAQ